MRIVLDIERLILDGLPATAAEANPIRSAVVRELRQLTALLVGPAQAAPKRRAFALPSLW